VSDRLRPLWDFDDLDATESRFRVQLEGESDDAGRAEVLTQLARVDGLRDDFDGCERLLNEAEALAGASVVAKVRIEHYFAGDAAHMCALAVSEDRAAMEEWTQRGLDLGEREASAAYWAGPLLNNLGWAYFDAGEHEHALELFERALDVRKRDPDNPDAISFAEEAVETARQALG
jgi:tetratricopeptide (TPR) repeat protein